MAIRLRRHHRHIFLAWPFSRDRHVSITQGLDAFCTVLITESIESRKQVIEELRLLFNVEIFDAFAKAHDISEKNSHAVFGRERSSFHHV